MTISVKDNGDGTGSILNNANEVLRILANGVILPANSTLLSGQPLLPQRVPFTINGTERTVVVPSWATRITILATKVSLSISTGLSLTVGDANAWLSAGYEQTVSSSATNGTAVGGGASLSQFNTSTSVGESAGTEFTARYVLEYDGVRWHESHMAKRGTAADATYNGVGSVVVALTRLRFQNVIAATGQLIAIFE